MWFHGDIAPGNLLLVDAGALTAVIDFGTSGVGDPACDLVIAWGDVLAARAARRSADGVDQDEGTWARARGWLLWKSLLTLTEHLGTDPHKAAADQHRIAEILANHDLHG